MRAEAASALREAAKRLAETEAEVSQLRGDVNALQEELDNRPTAAEQRCVGLLFRADSAADEYCMKVAVGNNGCTVQLEYMEVPCSSVGGLRGKCRHRSVVYPKMGGHHAVCRRLQREIDLLQRKIAAVRRQAATAQPGGAAAAGEDALSAASGDVWGADDRGSGGGRSRGTKAAIERDKALAKLGLFVVEELPRDVLVDVVQVGA